MKSYKLEQDVIMQVGAPSFHATRYTLIRFIFPKTDSGFIKDVPIFGFEQQGQIVNMRITSESGNVEFTLHSELYDDANPMGIVQRGLTVDEKDATVNELWTQWDVSCTNSNNKDIPFLWVSLNDLGATKGITRVELVIAT